jgi:glyoxylase-like metal-dependent hydrolase (beta-lactamase superfamily II)
VNDLRELDVGVHAWLDRRPGRGCPNAGVVVEADGVTVIDTLASPARAEPFAAAVEALGLPIRRVVLTCSHVEYAGGSSRFRLAAVYGSAQASVHLDQPPDPTILRRLLPELAGEIDDDFSTRPVSHVVDAPVQLTPACAVVPMSGEEVESLVAVVPGAGIVFAGAVCTFGVTPLAFQADLATWADALDRVVELAPVVVPGHGPIGGEEEVRQLQAYLRACVDARGNLSRLPAGPWDGWPGAEHHAVNVERAELLARGDDRIPSTLLARLGLA